MTERVELVSYDPAWPRLFELEARRVGAMLTGARIEHVGSTSIPGMIAKPFIDIVAGIGHESDLASAVSALEPTGYAYIPEAEVVVPERRFFRRADESPGYHLHVVARSAPLFANLPYFRDLLRSDASMARAYMQLKVELAQSHAADVDAYTVAKGPFIEAALATQTAADG